MRQSTGKKILSFSLFIGFLLVAGGCSSTSRLPEKKPDQVNIGYGEADRGNITSAVSSTRAKGPDTKPNGSVADILRGRAAGVEVDEVPGGGLRVRVRGSNSLMAGNAPLYVVDGFPVHTSNGVLYDINPKDIESITILKDAASTAIYGSRGANGVVLIKTKI